MNRELQDLTWSVLPKEFKEEVKKLYAETEMELSKKKGSTDNLTQQLRGMNRQLTYLFGHHNLISDTEPEEMLTVSRKRVVKIFVGQTEVQKCAPLETIIHYEATAKTELLYTLFGPKCLPNEVGNEVNFTTKEPKTAEPKYHVGEEMFWKPNKTTKHKYSITTVMQNEYSGKWEYNVLFEWEKPGKWIPESELEPYMGSEDI